MTEIMSCIMCDNNAQEMVDFYASAIPGARVGKKSYYGDFAPRVGQQMGALMTVDLITPDYEFMLLNVTGARPINPSISHYVVCKNAEEVDGVYAKLAAGGKDLMPLDKYAFSEKYAWVQDKFGVSWHIITVDMPEKVLPCLMFINKQNGRAQEAIDFYTSLFKNSSTESVLHYPPESGEAPEAIMHASFKLAGQKFIIMDSGHEHKFDFNEGISIMVNCDDQKEVDHLWEKLLEGGSESQCGWLKDKFGMSWQIVPKVVREMHHKGNQEKTDKLMNAVMTMRKLDGPALEAAYES